MIKSIFLFLFVITFSIKFSYAQERLKFVHLSDTHVGSSTGADDLRKTVNDINQDSSIQFIVISGDITEFGADNEIQLAKQILDSFNKRWYIIPGNHDGNWSESGANTFKKVFGSETFFFKAGKYVFLGTHCGPNMRMGPGQIPRENIVWLDSVLKTVVDSTPIIYLNHYPQDSSLNNWFEVIDRLKTKNVQLILCGHGHANRRLNFEGIPAVMGRSNLRARNSVGAYNVVTIKDGVATFEEKNPLTNEQRQWTEVKLVKRDFAADTTKYFRPSYAINSLYPNVKLIWQYKDNSDIGSGASMGNDLIFATNTRGSLYALNKRSGKKIWEFTTGGKIYSTPAVAGDRIIISSTDNNIYCVDRRTGKQIWKFETLRPIVANPIVKDQMIFIGSSDGHFRAIDLARGQLKWDFDSVNNFVVTKPLFYGNKIIFGSWGTELYALNANSGNLEWKWNNGSTNRMFSPAACFSVATRNKIFIVAPDRYMTALDAENGNVLWRKQDPANRVRESMGLSRDSNLIYAKTMDGFVIGVSTTANEMQIVWKSETQLGYELAPTAIVENQRAVLIPSDKGIVTAVNRADGKVLWKYKISNSLVTTILPVSKTEVVVTTMDGKISLLRF